MARTPLECQDRLEVYRAAGTTLPISSPRPAGTDAEQPVIEALKAAQHKTRRSG